MPSRVRALRLLGFGLLVLVMLVFAHPNYLWRLWIVLFGF